MHFQLFNSKIALEEHAPNGDMDLEQYVKSLVSQSSGLGKGAAELNGLIGDLAEMSSTQTKTFTSLAAEIDAMVQANRTICDVTKASHESVHRARQAVEQVGTAVAGVTDTLADVIAAANEITKIALQTRLVAFNAAVEAKRAGEAGRGFGVVADAVKDLAARVEQSSKMITNSITQLDVRIRDLSQDILSKETRRHGANQRDSFHAAVSEVEQGVDDIAATAQKNLDGCAGVIQTVRGLSSQVAGSANALQNARRETEDFLSVAETMIEMAVESGVRTGDTPYIEAAIDLAAEIGRVFEQGVRSGAIAAADLFAQKYRPITGTNPPAYLAPYSRFVDPVLPAMLEKMMAMSAKITFCIATDCKGYVSMNVAVYCKPYGADPVWNQANCRYHRFFDGRTEMAAIRHQGRFLLQTYRRDMGGGKFVVMKHLSAPILVDGTQWGAVRIGLQF